ncbi:unnamed protein product [Caenorhabditis sp. 36 PRJEB53466]|nr:unnamed protein product [Caenorhabditis sp. 36 PRJEB53466]
MSSDNRLDALAIVLHNVTAENDRLKENQEELQRANIENERQLAERMDAIDNQVHVFTNRVSGLVARIASVEAELRKEKKKVKREREKVEYYESRMNESEQKCGEQTEQREDAPPRPECDICLQEYSAHPDHVPRVLSCGHTVCDGCSLKMVISGQIVCPFDRKRFSMPEEGLPKNYEVAKMLCM